MQRRIDTDLTTSKVVACKVCGYQNREASSVASAAVPVRMSKGDFGGFNATTEPAAPSSSAGHVS
jgi:hypothetical protein